MLESFGSGLFTLIVFLLMLGLLVLVHELGHFWTAVRLGIKVEEFGIGFPPRAVTLFERDGVKYTLNWLPIGGFVRFGGESETVYGVGSLAMASPWKKIAVLFAGPLMNLLLAMAIFIGVFAAYGIPRGEGAQIGEVFPGTPAAQAGLQADDQILRINGTSVVEEPTQIREIARSNLGREVEIVVLRDGRELSFQVTPGPWRHPETNQEGQGLGINYQPVRFVNTPVSFFEAISLGFTYTWDILGRFISGIGQLFGGLLGINPAPEGGVTGIVGIARGTGEVIQQDGLIGFLRWTALISLNLFLINLLPIPALDGSHIMFSIIEILRRGKKIPPEREAMVHAVGFVMLMVLMVVVTIADVAHWVGGGSVLGGS